MQWPGLSGSEGSHQVGIQPFIQGPFIRSCSALAWREGIGEWGFSRTSECEILETELISHAKIIIARRTKLRPLARGRHACAGLSLLALYPSALLACAWLYPTPVGSLQQACRAAVLSDKAFSCRNRRSTGPLWLGFFLYGILL